MGDIRSIAIEGNICSGKTSLLEFLRTSEFYDEFRCIKDTEQKWCKFHSLSMFEFLNRDSGDDTGSGIGQIPRKLFQCHSQAQLSAYKRHLLDVTPKVKVMERSIFSSQYVIAKTFMETGVLSFTDYLLLEEWFKELIRDERTRVDLFIYLRTGPRTALDRIMERGTYAEQFIKEPFMGMMDAHLEQWLLTGRDCPRNVFTVDADQHRSDIADAVIEYLRSVLNE